VVNGGQVSPGHSPGTVDVNGNYTQTAGGLLNLEIFGPSSTQYDHLIVSGTATFDGTILISFLGGFQPFSGEQFDLIDAGSLLFQLGAQVQFADLPPGVTPQQSGGNSLVMEFDSTAPEPRSLAFVVGGLAAVFFAGRRARKTRNG
jgi:hypothetical protein